MTAQQRRVFGLVLLAFLGGPACDDVDWPEPRYVDSLRVLGVRADPPTLTPGGATRLSLVCADGRGGPRSDPTCDIEVAWFGGCDNPLRNDPETCFDAFGAWGEQLANPVAATAERAYPDGFGFGPEFVHAAPPDILAGETQVGERRVRVGTSYVFFAACAGTLVPSPGVADRLPLECRERETGELLDHRSMVAGVTTLYSYDVVASRNPVLLAPRFDEVAVPVACGSPEACPTGFECTELGRCAPVVPPCRAVEPDDCPEHCLTVAVAQESFSLLSEDGSSIAEPKKSVWLEALTNAGQLPADEASFGIRPPREGAAARRTPCIRWQAPTTPTRHAHLWTVVRDNRGGLASWDLPIIVRE